MPVQADKNPPSTPVKRERINDFSGGLNTTINASLLNKNEAQHARNVAFEQKGTISPRKGRRARFSNVITNHAVTGMGVYYKMDGTTRLMIAAYDTLYSDSPHLSVRYDSQGDFGKGTLDNKLSSALTPGKLVLDAGVNKLAEISGTPALADMAVDKFYANIIKPVVNLQINKLEIYTDIADKTVTYAMWSRKQTNPGETPAKYAYTTIIPPVTITSKAKAWADKLINVELTKDVEYVLCISCNTASVLASFPTFTADASMITLVGTAAGTNNTAPPEGKGLTAGGYGINLYTAKSSVSHTCDTANGSISATATRSGSNVSIKKNGVDIRSVEDLTTGTLTGLRNTQEGYLMCSTGYTWLNAIAIAPTWSGLISSMGGSGV